MGGSHAVNTMVLQPVIIIIGRKETYLARIVGTIDGAINLGLGETATAANAHKSISIECFQSFHCQA